MNILPVTTRFFPGTQSVGPFMGAPCVEISYTFDPPTLHPGGKSTMTGINKAWALLDTGADANQIDVNLIPPGLVPLEQVTVTGVAGAATMGNYHSTIHIPEWDWILQASFVAMPHVAARPYTIILGRKFLQLVSFNWDGRVGITDLIRIDNPGAV